VVPLPPAGGGNGRVHSQIATTVMLPMENHFTQAIGTHHSMMPAHAAMVIVAIHLP